MSVSGRIPHLVPKMAALLAGLPLISCDAREQAEDAGDTGPDTVLLEIVDSIGVELGDSNYVFGSIDRICFYSDGSILALDRVGGCIRRFSPEGEFLQRIGSRGSGPGEYLNPSDLIVLGDGRVMVCDIYTGGVHLLDTAFVDQGVKIPFFSDPPFFPVAALDSSFVAGAYTLDIEDDRISMDYFVGRFDMAPEPAVTYLQENIPIDPSDVTAIVNILLYFACWAVDGEGNVFVARMTTDSYEVKGYRPDGTEYLTISRPVDPVPRSEQEMALEEAFIEGRMTSMGSNLPAEYEASPWRLQIRWLDTDGDGNVWVLRGTEVEPTFDVYDKTGSPLFTAIVQGAGENGLYWRFTIDDEGILAWSEDPEDYSRIFVLSPVE